MRFYALRPFDGQPATQLVRWPDHGPAEWWRDRDQSWVPQPTLSTELLMNPDYEPVDEADVPSLMGQVALIQIG